MIEPQATVLVVDDEVKDVKLLEALLTFAIVVGGTKIEQFQLELG